MTKQIYRLIHQEARRRASEGCLSAPDGFIVTISEPTRNLNQSAKFHAICNDISKQAIFMRRKLSPEQWKVLFISGHSIATGLGAEIVPGIENEFVNIRESTTAMSSKRMSSLIEYVLAYCANNDIRLSA